MVAAAEKEVIKFEKVSKEYPIGDRKLRVLNEISFTVRKGEFVSIMGPSGSGKSTMLQMIGCLDLPTFGKVFIDGEDISTFGANRLAEVRCRKIGFVFQAFNLLSNLSALENVEIAMAINEMDSDQRRERALKLLEKVGLTDRKNHRPRELSGGEKQRVAIARALANNPSFLLADEPTGNLDSKSGEEVMELISELGKGGATIVLVTHEPAVAQYSKRIIHLRDGRIEYEDKPIAIKEKNLKLK
ncbi:MAG: ABC transporter ATP-binding protein [Candidatus Micrarchaeota archaeon]